MRQVLGIAFVLTMLASCAPAVPEESGVVQADDLAPEFIPDVVYGHKFGMALTFDVYLPEEPNGAGVMWISSGGYFSPNRGLSFQEGKNLLLPDAPVGPPPDFSFGPLLDRGFTLFVVRHGSSPVFGLPEIVDDLRRAVRFVRENGATWGVDPDRLGVWGGSSGGHLALLLGLAPEIGPEQVAAGGVQTAAPLAAVVAYFPLTDLEADFEYAHRFIEETQGVPFLTAVPALDIPQELYRPLSPVQYASADDPPTLMLHHDQDPLVSIDQSELMRDALDAVGVTTELIVVEGAGHGFSDEDADRAVSESLSWFERYLK